jgi:protocatechuate 3,4-dioxygenase alpha subunit
VRDGLFEFVTVKPGSVPWPGGGEQAPHVVLGVFARGLLKRAVTRMYFPDEDEANAADPVLSGLAPGQRETLVATPDDGGMRFDIHLQGPRHTTFFAC